jgi:hypothetical protein
MSASLKSPNAESSYPSGLTRTLSRSEPLRQSDQIDIRVTDGNVSLEGWNREEIVINARLIAPTASVLESMDVKIESSEDRTIVREEFGSERPPGCRIDLMVRMPGQLRKWAVSLINGRIFCRHLSGNFSVDVVNGDVSVYDVAGASRISSVNGVLVAYLTAVQHPDRLELVDMSGNIVLRINRRATPLIQQGSGAAS